MMQKNSWRLNMIRHEKETGAALRQCSLPLFVPDEAQLRFGEATQLLAIA